MVDVTTSTPQAGQDRRGPGRPRSARADEAIIDAVVDLFEEGNTVEGLSIEAIAARAGVGKATVYRRWANKEELIVDAVVSLKGPVPAVRGESVRDDLIELLNGVGQSSGDRAERILAYVMPELQHGGPVYGCYQDVIAPRRAAAREVLRRGIRTGELRADLDVELALGLLVAPVLVQRFLRWNPDLDPTDLAARVVDAVLAGIAAR